MDDTNPAIQKLKGQLKQAKGKLQEMAGDKMEGRVKQIEGKAQEEIAELRLSQRRKRDVSSEEQQLRSEKERLAREEGVIDEDDLS